MPPMETHRRIADSSLKRTFYSHHRTPGENFKHSKAWLAEWAGNYYIREEMPDAGLDEIIRVGRERWYRERMTG